MPSPRIKTAIQVRAGTPNEKLEKAVHLALDRLTDTLHASVPASHRQFVRMHSVQVRAAAVVMNTMLRSDETALRRQIADRMPHILRLIKEERARLARAEAEEMDDAESEAAE